MSCCDRNRFVRVLCERDRRVKQEVLYQTCTGPDVTMIG